MFSVFQVFQVFWVIEPKDSLKNKTFRPVKFDFYGQNWEEIVLNFSYLYGLLGLLGLLSLMGLLGLSGLLGLLGLLSPWTKRPIQNTNSISLSKGQKLKF